MKTKTVTLEVGKTGITHTGYAYVVRGGLGFTSPALCFQFVRDFLKLPKVEEDNFAEEMKGIPQYIQVTVSDEKFKGSKKIWIRYDDCYYLRWGYRKNSIKELFYSWSRNQIMLELWPEVTDGKPFTLYVKIEDAPAPKPKA